MITWTFFISLAELIIIHRDEVFDENFARHVTIIDSLYRAFQNLHV